MGHARLSVIDPAGGAQPLYGAAGELILTANGEFYDYKRVRTDLTASGDRFATKSDSEIALHLYERHGLDFIEHLRGEFAFALFDARRDRLILVRDRFGVRPLYYRLDGDALYYGSEVKAVLAHPEVPSRIDARAALSQMMQVMVPGTTSFEGVEALLPGHALVVERRGGRLRATTIRYWDLEFPTAGDHGDPHDAEPHIRAVRERLTDSVATRLEADVPVGCYLSGGIDSCSILGLASPLQQSPIQAFTIAFDHAAYDESAIAAEMAAASGAQQELLRLDAGDLYGDAFETVAFHAERTFYNTLAVAKWHMSRRVRECGYKVVITGEGSDELFGGYPFFVADMAKHAPEALGEARANPLFTGAILAEEERSHPAWDELCGFTPTWIQPWILTLESVRPLLAPAFVETLGDYDPIAEIAATIDPAMVRGRHPLDIAQYTWSKTMLEGQILTWGGDRVDMANALESRPAFLDHHVAECAVGIPPGLRVRDGVEKWVLREAMKGILPTVLYERPKFAFMAPPSGVDESKSAAIGDLADTWLAEDRVRETGMFDPAAVEGLRQVGAGDPDAPGARRHDIVMNHLVQIHMLDAFAREDWKPALAA